MSSTKRRLTENPADYRGMTGDFRRLRDDSSAAADELREFMGSLHGKTPQEMLGLVAESGLTQGILLATAGVSALLLVFTIGPYFFSDAEAATKTAKAKAAQQQSQPAETPPQTAAAPAATPVSDPSAPANVDLEKASKVLGLDETKTADPKANPLDKKLDGLLDGIN